MLVLMRPCGTGNSHGAGDAALGVRAAFRRNGGHGRAAGK